MKNLTSKKRPIRLYTMLSLTRIVEIAYMLVLFILFAGIINALLEGQNLSNYIIVPSFTVQSFMETFLDFLAIIIGTIGVYLMYLGGRRTGRRAPSLYVISGWITLVIGMLIWLFIIGVKGG
jgi:hypothetical protein